MRRFSSILLLSVPRSPIVTISPKTGMDKSYQKLDLLNSYFQNNILLSSKQQHARLSTLGKEPENRNQLQVEIICKEYIKPASPTPEHSKSYEFSIIDQLYPNLYTPFVYFYTNGINDSQQTNHANLIMKRRDLLKQSLSEVLTRFYPLAGRIKDSRNIDCNDDGVYYVEAEVSNSLSDFLNQPDNKSIHRLLPLEPNSMELLSKNDLAMIQVTTFSCGGIAIGIYTSHKMIDGYSLAIFIKAWAATARASLEEIRPKFIAPLIFPYNPSLSGDKAVFPLRPQSKTATRRIVFRDSSLATLKKKAGSSRVMSVIGFLWKCAIAASKAQATTQGKGFSLTTVVNLRKRSSPPMPPYCMGNIALHTAPIHYSADEDLGLDSIVQRLKSSTEKMNGDFVEEIKGEGFALAVKNSMNMLKMFYSDVNIKHMFVSSICNAGMYEADFGWGKPVWISYAVADADIPTVENSIILMDRRSGDGIEAWVTLKQEDMNVFLLDPELLSLASVNPSPLHPIE